MEEARFGSEMVSSGTVKEDGEGVGDRRINLGNFKFNDSFP